MKKYIFLLFFSYFGICSLNAQVGIGTVTPQAQLDVVTEATATSERKGIQVDLNSSSTAQQNTYSLHLTNSSSPSLTASKYGIFSNVSGAGTATRYGVYSEVFQPSSNPTGTDLFGVYSLLGLSTGVNKNAYGFYADITNVNNTANIYGVYSTVAGSVANQDVYSGYFLGGKFSIGQTTSNNYILPSSRGYANQIMQTDGVGNVSWVDKDANSFSLVRANLTANQGPLGNGGWQKISFNSTAFDTNTEFDTTQNRFVATNAGFYRINAGFHTNYQNNKQYYSIGVYVNGALYQETSYNHHNSTANVNGLTGSGDVMRSINCLVQLSANDFVEIYIQNYQGSDVTNGNNGVIIDSYNGKTYFEIQRVR